MRDLSLKRTLHFACGFVVGGLVCVVLGLQLITDGDQLTWCVVGGLAGGIVVGFLAMRGLDRFWDRWAG